MQIIPSLQDARNNRYGVVLFDVLGNIAVDVQHVSNTIKGCAQAIKKYSPEVPFATACIYRIARCAAGREAIPVKQYSAIDVAKICNTAK
jgi:hypothetical protein